MRQQHQALCCRSLVGWSKSPCMACCNVYSVLTASLSAWGVLCCCCVIWLACVQVIVADTFTSLSAQNLGPDAWLSQRPVVLLCTGVLVTLMCFPKNLSALGEGLAAVIHTAGAAFCLQNLLQASHALHRGSDTIRFASPPIRSACDACRNLQEPASIACAVYGW